MKYVDSITRKKNKQNKEKYKDIKTKRLVLGVRNINIYKLLVNLYKKRVWFLRFVSLIIVAFIVVVVIVVRKRPLADEQTQELISDKKEQVVTSKIDDLPEELKVFHIKIDVEGFHVDSDIIEGKTDDDLHKGIVHQEGSAFPSQHSGNVVITGHRWYPGDGKFSKVFENINKLKQGDKIIIEYKNKRYIYNIDKKEIVEKSNTKFLAHTTKPQLTLYTCHPKFTSNQRLVYIANLESVENIK